VEESPRRPGGDEVEDVTVLAYLWSKEPGEGSGSHTLVSPGSPSLSVDRSSLSLDSTTSQ
jgi:hypothetical protein